MAALSKASTWNNPQKRYVATDKVDVGSYKRTSRLQKTFHREKSYFPIMAKERDVRIARFSAQVSTELLNNFAKLIDEGHVKVFVGPVFSLNEAGKAQELSQSGHGRGRIVLHIA